MEQQEKARRQRHESHGELQNKIKRASKKFQMNCNQGENATESHGATALRRPGSIRSTLHVVEEGAQKRKGCDGAPGPAKDSSCARRLGGGRAHAHRTAHNGALHRNHMAAELHVASPSKREFDGSRRCRGPNCKAPLVELHARVGRAACPWAESADRKSVV